MAKNKKMAKKSKGGRAPSGKGKASKVKKLIQLAKSRKGKKISKKKKL